MLTSSLFFRSAVSVGLLGLLLLFPLGLAWPADAFRKSRRAVVMGASLFWLGFTFVFVQAFWAGYYQFFYPGWMKWGILAVAFIVFPALAFVFHWLACRLPAHPLIWFCLLAGLEAVVEHVVAWYATDLPAKVPYLTSLPLFPVLVFAFFEYQVYWAVALWLAWALTRLALARDTWIRRRK